MENDNCMSERILRSLEYIFKNDHELKEFAIVPTDDNNKNKSPVLYEEHNVGLESWCIKYIYHYAYSELFDVRHLLHRRKLTFSKEHNLNHLLIGVLLINPDVNTFWNMKRELVTHEILAIDKELIFTKLVLSYKSKSNEAFAYRRWLLERIFTKIPLDDQSRIENLLRDELQVCEMTAEKMPNNYHSWNHRIWCLTNFLKRICNVNRIILEELEFSYQWLLQHVSEHTGCHYRQFLFNLVKSNQSTILYDSYYRYIIEYFRLNIENDPRTNLISLLGKHKFHPESLEQTNKTVNYLSLLIFDLYKTLNLLDSVFPCHETLWYHRRYLIQKLIETVYEYHELKMKPKINLDNYPVKNRNIVDVTTTTYGYSDGEKQPKLFKSLLNEGEESLLYREFIKKESAFVEQKLNDGIENKYARRHEKWLKFVLGIQLS